MDISVPVCVCAYNLHICIHTNLRPHVCSLLWVNLCMHLGLLWGCLHVQMWLCIYPCRAIHVRLCEANSTMISFNLISAPVGALQLTRKGREARERLRPRTRPPRWGRGAFKGLVWPRRDQQTQLICHCNSIFTSFQFQRAVWLH